MSRSAGMTSSEDDVPGVQSVPEGNVDRSPGRDKVSSLLLVLLKEDEVLDNEGCLSVILSSVDEELSSPRIDDRVLNWLDDMQTTSLPHRTDVFILVTRIN